MLIEKELNIGNSSNWKQRDFEYLGNKIFQKTGILLSLSTIKRIWDVEFQGMPHPATLNALAKFIEYESWQDFKKNMNFIDEQGIGTSVTKVKEKFVDKKVVKNILSFTGKPIIIVTIIFMILGILIAHHLVFNSDPTDAYSNIVFTSKKTVTSGVPNSVIFNYDISHIEVDSAYIQQSWDPNRRDRINKENRHHASMYYYPGLHRAKLIVNDEIIKEHDILITTNGWLGFVIHKFDDKIPVYIPDKEVFIDGKLYISPEILKNNNVNITTNPFWINFCNIQDFGNLDGDNFTLETQIKNDLAEGGSTCQYSGVFIITENSGFFIPLADSGCVSTITVQFMDTMKNGRNHNLSSFGCDLSKWHTLKCLVINKKANISLDDKHIFTISYQQPAGRIIGIRYLFGGCGAVNFVKLFDNNGNSVFFDDFK